MKELNRLELELEFNRSTKKQREEFERYMIRNKWKYSNILKVCSEVTRREIGSIGRLTSSEITRISRLVKSGKFSGRERLWL